MSRISPFQKPISSKAFAGVFTAVLLATTAGTATLIATSGVSSAAQGGDLPTQVVAETTTTLAPVVESAPEDLATTTTLPASNAVDISSGATVISATSAALAEPSWSRSGSAQCNCSAEFPWPTKPSTSRVNEKDAHLLLSEKADHPLSAAIWSSPVDQVDPETLNALLDAVVTGNGQVSSRANTTRAGGDPMITAELRQGAGTSKVAVFAQANTAYVLLMGSNAGTVPETYFQRFTASFKLK